MSWFNDLQLRWKLIGAFALLGALMCGMDYIGITTAQMITAELDEVIENYLPSTALLGELKFNAASVGLDLRGGLLEATPGGAKTFIDKVDLDTAAIEKSWTAYKALPAIDSEKALWPAFDQSYTSWKGDVAQAQADVRSGDLAAKQHALDMFATKLAPESAATFAAVDAIVHSQTEQAAAAERGSASSFDRALKMLLGALVLGILCALGMGVFLSRSIGAQVASIERTVTSLADKCATWLADALNAFARGDLTIDIQPVTAPIEGYGEDELGRTAGATNRLRDRLLACIASYQEARAGLGELVGEVQASANSLADVSAQLGSAASQTGSAVQQVTMAVQNVASGAQETSRSAQETTASVGQLSQVIDGIARGATDQARQVHVTSTTATQMAAGIEQVASNATQVAAASQQAKLVAERGGQAVRETTAAMNEIHVVVGQAASKVRELGTLGQKIGAVVETIDDIAEQTNLLALNAAIEAARAGEHGKGFAVVADEVRKLAERSGRETKQISELISQVQTGTKDAVGAMDTGAAKVELGSQKAAQAGEALDQILVAVQDTVRQVGDIASASQQMAGGARNVTDSMHSISAMVEESSAATEEMAAQASAVSSSIASIAAVSEQQSAATEEVSASTEEMSAQVEEMAAQAQELAATAEQLRALVARFKLEDHPAAATAGVRKSAGRSAARMVTPLRRVA